jgi:synaptobrevin family protein YKT6
MRVFSIIILNEAKIMAAESDLSTFSFFQRGSIQEFIHFFAQTLCQKTAPNSRQQIKEQRIFAILLY